MQAEKISMIVPAVFNKFAIGFIQGSDKEYTTMPDWIHGALGRLKVEEKQELKAFIDTLLQSNPTEDELQKIWMATVADYYLYAHGTVRGFFALVSEEAGKQL